MRRMRWFIAALLVAFLAGTGASTAGTAPVRVRFVSLAWQKQAVEAVKEVVTAWNRTNPSVQVDYAQVDWGAIHDYMLTSFQTGNVPDVFHYESIPILDFAKRGFLTDLTPMIPPEMRADIFPGAWQTVLDEGGKIFAVPYLWESLIILYNKKLFRDAGITPPTIERPWTWDDLQKAAKTLTKDRDGDGRTDQFGTAIGLRSPVNRVLNLSMGFGGTYFYTQGGRNVVLVGEGERALLSILLDMLYVSKTASLDGLGRGSPELIPGFIAGRYAMLPGIGVWARQGLVESAPADFEWGVLPPLKAKTQYQGSATQTLSIPTAAKNKEAAWQFIQFALNRDNMAKQALGDWLFPTRQSSIRVSGFTTTKYGWDVSTDSVRYLRMAPWQKILGYSEWRTRLATPLMNELFANRISLEEFVSRLVAGSPEILDRYR
ncbi:MAG: ABC transporter substrate-binding protein [bacterium]